jgi:8-oxo-dGTP pyrophosphatase MutT (NUDIX family)
MAKTKQVGALPWRQRDGGLEFLLVTTRTTRRWVIPKGWPMADRADHQAAEQEALEEAGVIGHVAAQPMGHFNYLKLADSGKSRMLRVDVYPLEVTDELENWMEKVHRARRWMKPAEAMTLAGEPELVGILNSFSEGFAKVEPTGHVTKTTLSSATSRSKMSQIIAWLKGQPQG